MSGGYKKGEDRCVPVSFKLLSERVEEGEGLFLVGRMHLFTCLVLLNTKLIIRVFNFSSKTESLPILSDFASK